MRGGPDLRLIAAHELRLAWRDLHAMLTARRRWKTRTVIFWLILAIAFAHLVAWSIIEPASRDGLVLDRNVLVPLGGSLVLTFAVMLSQAIEQVTRVFYARGDLDLLLSSPVDAGAVSAVRIGAIALTSGGMMMLAAAAFINVMAALNGVSWLAAYLVLPALSMASTALAVLVACFLFGAFGARRTRLIAQIVAAIIGAAFIVGVNLAAVLSMQGYSRVRFFRSDGVMALAPGESSLFWWPVRALAGETAPLFAVIVACTLMLAGVIAFMHRRFASITLAASAASRMQRGTGSRRHRFAVDSPTRTLRQKEWLLLLRDPWLVSQSLMQIFYLIPPAAILWTQFGSGGDPGILVVPVLVMATGQLAGGLAWLTVSGEDAPDLIASAPLAPGRILRAKVEAVAGAVGVVALPVIILLAVHSPPSAAIALATVMIACAAATAIQLWFRGQARRSHFRHRQTTSRIAALCEAGVTISLAGVGGLWAFGSLLALLPALLAAGIMLMAWRLGPGGDTGRRMYRAAERGVPARRFAPA